jgi:hypothetical protein
MNDDKTQATSLNELMKNLAPASAWREVHQPEELRAAELLRQRLIRQVSSRRLSRSERLRITTTTRRLQNAMVRANVNWLEVDDMQYSLVVHNDKGVDLILKAQTVMIVPIAYGSEFRYVRSQVEKALRQIMKMHTTVGRTVEVVLTVTGEEPQEKLEEYRQIVLENLLLHVELPLATFMTSMTVFGGSNTSDTLRKIEALVQYIHWLEDQSFMPRILWVRTNSRKKNRFWRLLG